MAESSFRIDNLVSALVGGMAGGLLVWWLVPAAPEASTTPDDTVVPGATAAASPVQAPAEAEEGAHERLKTLEKRMYQMQKRVTEQAQVDVYEEGEGEDKRITLSAADPKFQSAVRAVIDKAKWEQEQLEQDERDQRRDERIARQVDELVKELDLSDDQADQVEFALQNRAEAFRNLRNGENRPITRSDWRKKFGEIQAKTRKELAEVLDDGQLQAYDKYQESQFGPWSGRPRPPRPAPQ